MTTTPPKFPTGLPTWVCRACQTVGLSQPKCPQCGASATLATVYNLPPGTKS